MVKNINCLAFSPHPDDAELFCGGLLAKLKKQGHTTAIVDLTRGEMSTNGSPETRDAEAEKAAKILGLDERHNCGIPDGNIEIKIENRKKIVKLIRGMRPEICLVPYWLDRHPDHEAASRLIKRCIFDAGLIKMDTGQEIYRPPVTLYYMLHTPFDPSFVVDISDVLEVKHAAIDAYESQLSVKNPRTQSTHINRPEFMKGLTTRAAYFGQMVNVPFGEAYYYQGVLKIDNILQFFS